MAHPSGGAVAGTAALRALAFAVASAVLFSSHAAHAHTRSDGSGEKDVASTPPADTTGTGRIAGDGSCAFAPGVTRTIALQTVVLRPVTTWSRRWWDHWALHGQALVSGRPGALDVRGCREVAADSSGRFHFDDLPEGQYFLQSTLFWVEGSGNYGTRTHFGIVGDQVTLGPGEHATVSLHLLHTEIFDPWWHAQPGGYDQPTPGFPAGSDH